MAQRAKLIFALIIKCCAALLLSCNGGEHVRKHIFFRMDTVIEISISTQKSFDAKPLWRSIDSLLSASEKRFSASSEFSEIKKLNERGEKSAIPISKELCEMLRTGLDYGDTLKGAFDITVMPLKKIWGLCEECDEFTPLPDSALLNETVQLVNYKLVTLSENCDTVFFASPHTQIDLGGIAKGYVLTQLYALLKNSGVDNFLVAAGGDIVAEGTRGANTPWRVGVRHPRDNSQLVTTFPLAGGAVVTSGDYTRYRIVDGKRYHHIFDTQTGASCGSLQSLTIIAQNPIIADILSTGLFCKRPEDVLSFVNAREGVDFVLVDSAGTVLAAAASRCTD